MDATEYVGRRAERALGSLPALLVTAAAVCAVAGLVQLWRLTAPSLGLGAPAAAGSLWQRVTMGIGNGYDVTPLAWGALALAVLAALATAPRRGLPTPGPRLRRTAAGVALALVVLSVAAVVLVVVWALASRGEVSFSFEAPGDQDGNRITTEVGTYQTDVWTALVRVAPAVVAAALSVGAAAALLRPAVEPVTEPVTESAAEPAVRSVAEPGERPASTATAGTDPAVEAWSDGTGTTPYDGSGPGDPVAARVGHRGSGGSERFARSLPPSGGARSGPTGDPLDGWTVGPGVSSDVAFRRPGSAADRAPVAANGSPQDSSNGASNGAADPAGGGADGAAARGTAAARDPYRRPGA